MTIKVATLKSSLKHSDNLSEVQEQFLAEIESYLNEKIELTTIDDYDCDLKLIFIETGGSEGYFKKNFDVLKPPYYLLTNGANNSLAASLEILTYLNNNNLKGEVLHGNSEYIANRIRQIATFNKAKNYLENSNFGVVGKPSDWLISSIPNYEEVKRIYGINLIDISLDEVSKKVPTNKKDFNFFDKEFDKEELEKSNDIFKNLDDVITKYNLKGLTLRCFDLLTLLHSTGCLALSYFNDHDLIGTCEGDIMAMVSMAVIRGLTDKPTFQANPSRIDTTTNRIIFAHCTIPTTMLDSFKLDTHFESGIGVAIKGELKTEDITIFRLSSDMKRFFVSDGKIIRNLSESNLCRTQIEVELEEDVSNLLTNPCGNHHIIVYGHYANLIKDFMKEILN